MRVQLTKEHIDAAVAVAKEYDGNVERFDICKCCPIWQSLRPIVGHDNFTVGFNIVHSADKTLGTIDHAGQVIALTPVASWAELTPLDFEYTPESA